MFYCQCDIIFSNNLYAYPLPFIHTLRFILNILICFRLLGKQRDTSHNYNPIILNNLAVS